ncbi:diguanylate cyclase (GGDEF) domain-containing protein [Noviherbaspirillum humi]|uniref:diguanylate cyclase n=1 Tax=Noviherbaspirillum humi TaxID=1688639 RepID=A0A239CAE8_9BURK|nr:GGDEF domain-containing protein [Noviherbaspirillum humi]SNS17205.1 diguanylate cyclase (GGDEF) domain-containing protein [Noviherbaspirillum humi]
METLVAAASLIAVQLSGMVVMFGLMRAAPHERCTRYWAASAALAGIGVLLIMLNNGAYRPAILVLGNNFLICGVVLQWCGIRVFFRKTKMIAGWAIGGAFFLLFGLLVLQGAGVMQRSVLSSATILLLLTMSGIELWRSQPRTGGTARTIALGGCVLLCASYTFRLGALLSGSSSGLSTSTALPGLAMLYIIPTFSSLLLWSGLLLLYFERIVGTHQHQATHDELTGLLNRRALTIDGERALSLAQRLHAPLTVAFIDIDHFKDINDSFGHEAGDRVLVEVANIFRQTCRNVDLVGRYGGEEFCFVFPGIDRDGAVAVASRLVQTVRMHDFRLGRPVTASIGLAVTLPEAAQRDWHALLREADAQLYKAKHAGRNRYCIDQPRGEVLSLPQQMAS